MSPGRTGYVDPVKTPSPRGRLSDHIFTALRGSTDAWSTSVPVADDPEDAAITLWAMYELHYHGFDGVDDGWEWHPGLLRARADLEARFEDDLRRRHAAAPSPRAGDLAASLFAYVEGHEGPSLSGFVQRRADREQLLELLRHRSVYALRESDPTAWLVPRVGSRTQAALMSLQYDEYGGGDASRVHAHLFARGMAACRMSPEFGAYVDDAPVEVLEQNNAMTLFGLHRRLRAAGLGHLAAFEATSSLPSRRMAQGLRRLDFPDEMVAYYDEHVEADAVHEQLAVREICGPLVEGEPELRDEVFFGAFVCLDSEARVAGRLLDGWEAA
jgi:hypothetical protein